MIAMINLLPPHEKQVLKLVETQKKILVILTHLLLCLIFLAVIIFLSGEYISLKTIELENMVFVRNQELENYRFQDLKEVILEINQSLAKVRLFQREEVRIGPFLEEIVSLAPGGISFKKLTFRKASRIISDQETAKATEQIFASIHLAGTAATREVLYSFKKILEGQEHFQEVYFSPQSWTKPIEALFNVNFEVLYKEIPL